MAREAGVGGKGKSFSKKSTKSYWKAPTKSRWNRSWKTPVSIKKPVQPAPPKVRPPTRQVAPTKSLINPNYGAGYLKLPPSRGLSPAYQASIRAKAKSPAAAAILSATKVAAKKAAAKSAVRPAARPVARVAPVKAAPKPVAAVAKPVAKAVAKPAPAPKPTTVTGSGTAAKGTTLSGRGSFGKFNRRRLNRGPRSGLSITPEQLQSIARQRIVNYH